MPASQLDDQQLAVLRALRRVPESSLNELAAAVGLPRTNFGRPLTRRLCGPISHLVAEGLIEEYEGRYRLADQGRRTLAERALGGTP